MSFPTFPTSPLELNALVVFDSRAHITPPITCAMNRSSCDISEKRIGTISIRTEDYDDEGLLSRRKERAPSGESRKHMPYALYLPSMSHSGVRGWCKSSGQQVHLLQRLRHVPETMLLAIHVSFIIEFAWRAIAGRVATWTGGMRRNPLAYLLDEGSLE